jgi:hypothetical protein
MFQETLTCKFTDFPEIFLNRLDFSKILKFYIRGLPPPSSILLISQFSGLESDPGKSSNSLHNLN